MYSHFTHRESDSNNGHDLLDVTELTFYLNHNSLIYSYYYFYSGCGYLEFIGRKFTLNLKQKRENDCDVPSPSRAIWTRVRVKVRSGKPLGTQTAISSVFAPWFWMTLTWYSSPWLLVSFLFAVFLRFPLHVLPHHSLGPASSRDLLTGTPSEW